MPLICLDAICAKCLLIPPISSKSICQGRCDARLFFRVGWNKRNLSARFGKVLEYWRQSKYPMGFRNVELANTDFR